MSDPGNRLARLRTSLAQAGLDGFLATHPPNLQYLLGFTGSLGVALITDDDCDLLVDSRYLEQAEQETTGCRVHLVPNPLGEDTRSFLRRPSRIGIEADTLSYAQALRWLSWADPWQIEPTHEFIEALREIKSPDEVEEIRASCLLARQSLDELLRHLSWGASETELAGRLEFLFRKRGAQGPAFETIVASGTRSSLPHARPGDGPVRREAVLLIDFGARRKGYCSDLTRVLLPDDEKVQRVAAIVRRAQQSALDMIRPGVSSTAVDAAARGVIAEEGFAGHFGHGTGHGLGLEIHERPRISTSGESTLAAGMVFTVEPGIYLPGEFGIRIEDVVAVTEAGCDVLSR